MSLTFAERHRLEANHAGARAPAFPTDYISPRRQRQKDADRARIAEDVAKFLAAGGTIQQVTFEDTAAYRALDANGKIRKLTNREAIEEYTNSFQLNGSSSARARARSRLAPSKESQEWNQGEAAQKRAREG